MASNPTCWVCPESFNYGYQVNEHVVSAHGVEALIDSTDAIAEIEADNARLATENARLRERAEKAEAIARKLADSGRALRNYIVRTKTKDLKGDAFYDCLEDGLAASTAFSEAHAEYRAALAASRSADAESSGEGEG